MSRMSWVVAGTTAAALWLAAPPARSQNAKYLVFFEAARTEQGGDDIKDSIKDLREALRDSSLLTEVAREDDAQLILSVRGRAGGGGWTNDINTLQVQARIIAAPPEIQADLLRLRKAINFDMFDWVNVSRTFDSSFSLHPWKGAAKAVIKATEEYVQDSLRELRLAKASGFNNKAIYRDLDPAPAPAPVAASAPAAAAAPVVTTSQTCAKCGAALAEGAAFCPKCGTKVASSISCPKCSAKNVAGARFCSSCGQALAEAQCAKCHAKLAPGAKFCASCGAKVS